MSWYPFHMCRLFAYTTKDPEKNTASLVQALGEFRLLAEKGCVPCGIAPGHMDGWGIVAYKEGIPCTYVRSVSPAHTDPRFLETLDIVREAKPDLLVAHLRKSTKGGNTLMNTHPFLSGTVSLCHNGTMEAPSLDDAKSDSLQFFEKIVTDGAGAASFKEIYAEYQKSYAYTAMNMIFADGKELFAVRNWSEENPDADRLGFEAYYTLLKYVQTDTVFVCSEKLAAFSGALMTALENKEMVEMAYGEVVRSSSVR